MSFTSACNHISRSVLLQGTLKDLLNLRRRYIMGSFHLTVKLSSQGLKPCVLRVRIPLQLCQLATQGTKSVVSREHGREI